MRSHDGAGTGREGVPILRITTPEGLSFDREVDEPEVSIGRARENWLQLPDSSLSRRHARILREPGGLVFEDLGSRNGSFINGRVTEGRVALGAGDRIELGACLLTVQQRAPVHLEEGRPAEATAIFDVTQLSPAGTQEVFTDASQEHRALALMSRAGTLLITHRPLDDVFAELLDLALEAFVAERAAVALLPDPDSEPEVASARDGQGSIDLQLSRTVARTVLEGRQAVAVIDVERDPRLATAQSVRLQGVRSLMCAPLWNGNAVSGLLYVDRRIGRGNYAEDDLKILSMLAGILAVKIENARLVQGALEKERLEEELDVARRIQRRLLPRDSEAGADVRVGGICRPCAEIGGDFFDHFPVAGRRHGIIVADVCGKGVGGALLAASLQAALRGGLHVEVPAAERVRWLNEFIHEHSPVDKYITAVYVEISASGGGLEYVTAGHPPPLLIRGDGQTEELTEGGLPLGLFPDAVHASSRRPFSPGDRLLLYTDGVTEAAPAGKREPTFGAERLRAAAAEAGPDPEAMTRAVFAALSEFTERAPLRDDATVVALTLAG